MDDLIYKMFTDFDNIPDSSESNENSDNIIEDNTATSETIPTEVNNEISATENYVQNGSSSPQFRAFLQSWIIEKQEIFKDILNKPFLSQNNLYCVGIDNNANVILYLLNQIGQWIPYAEVEYEDNKFVVKQNGIKLTTINPNSGFTGNHPAQSSQTAYNQKSNSVASFPVTQQYSYNFSNVPPEQAKDIIDAVMKNKPKCPVNIDFASQNMPQEIIYAIPQEIIYADNPEVIDVPADEIIDSPNDTEQ